MKIHKKILGTFFAILAIVALLPVQALAAGRLDLSRDVRLTISYQDEKTPLVGAQFDLYLAASVNEYGELTVTEDFAGFNVNMRGKDDEAWKTLASTLEGYVLRDNIKPADSGKTDRQGQVSFPSQQERLVPGLYLVLGSRHTQDGRIYDAAPFMALLPGRDAETDAWIYDVTVNSKFSSRPEPSGPDSSTITRKVLKVWADSDHENDRPAEVTVQLLCDGSVYDTVTLRAANNWRYTWEGLDARSQWTVVEEEQENYMPEVTREGITFVLTNTYAEDIPDQPTPMDPGPTPPEPPETMDIPDEPVPLSQLPQTGQLWWPVPVLTAAGLLLVIFGLLRRRGARHGE